MDPTTRLRLSLGFVSTAISMLFGTDRGRKSLLRPGAIEILYTSYFSRICMSDIAGMLEITPSSATDLVNYLEREGYVYRKQDPKNRRKIQVIPSEKGELWILQTEEKMYGFLQSRLSNLSTEEQDLFANLCARFSGVHDGISFITSIAAFRKERDTISVPLIRWRDGHLLRLEEAVDSRWKTVCDVKDQKMELEMISDRIPETTEGIQDEITVQEYDLMQRGLLDHGHLPVDDLVEMTKAEGKALEIGSGPGYYGLEWLKKTDGTHLTCLEISPAMIRLGKKNASDYGLSGRVLHREGNALLMPFPDESFDLVFSNGSLHEWEDAQMVFSGIHRVLKPGGTALVTDLRRDISEEIQNFMKKSCPSPGIKAGFETSIRAAYTQKELEEILAPVPFGKKQIIIHPYGLVVIAEK
ncbi:MAG: methyltransferase domain-containing protein [Methanospirillaceae archaeon]|nr:methyltransferase domain-containing protein [Methanospirillaceae archaeon]